MAANAGRNIILRLVGIVAVVALLGGGYFVYKTVVNPDHLGQVLFSTESQSSANGCSVSKQVTSVKSGTPVWSVYVFQHRVTIDQKIIEEDFKDGVSIGQYEIPSDKAAGMDCLAVMADLSSEFDAPGVYEIKLTVGTEVLADGKLTITP